uniref:Putative regulatory uORF n=1 Tax=Homo sapiens TaxID=9606 RepID=Q96J97_HUMAN|nr:putative regulatory uORF [Homo sapiens]AAL57876.1 putative regulatory uORF [Homo sapiens]
MYKGPVARGSVEREKGQRAGIRYWTRRSQIKAVFGTLCFILRAMESRQRL